MRVILMCATPESMMRSLLIVSLDFETASDMPGIAMDLLCFYPMASLNVRRFPTFCAAYTDHGQVEIKCGRVFSSCVSFESPIRARLRETWLGSAKLRSSHR